MERNRPKRGSDRAAGDVPLVTRALRLLARREHSRTELRAKLEPHAVDEAELEAVLEQLVARGWLSDARVAEQVVHARRGRYGSQRIRHELESKGLSADVVERAMIELRADDYARAAAIWRKRYGRPPRDAADAARQLRFLLARGFASEIARRVLRSHGASPDDEVPCG